MSQEIKQEAEAILKRYPPEAHEGLSYSASADLIESQATTPEELYDAYCLRLLESLWF